MPPKVKYSREAVLNAALALARRDGLQAVNARAVAKELGCSTQPLFREFQSMEQIRAEVLRMAGEAYGEYMRRSAALAPTPYKGTGMAYILFAREEPELFKLLFMRDRTGEAQEKFGEDESMAYIMPALFQSTGFTREEALEFHMRIWVFTHGLASMIATRFLDLTDEQISQLMSEEYHAMRMLYESRKEKKE